MEEGPENTTLSFEAQWYDELIYCGFLADKQDLVDTIGSWTWKASVVLGSLGLVGNILSFTTILSMKKRSLFYNLLLVLAIYDTIYIVTGGVAHIYNFFGKPIYSYPFMLFITKLVVPLISITLTGSTYTCVAIALERYLGISGSNSIPKFRKFSYFLASILLINLVTAGMRFLEYTPKLIVKDGEEDEDSTYKYRLVLSDLRKTLTYTEFIVWYHLVVSAIIPFLLMIVLNIRIMYLYRKQRSLLQHGLHRRDSRISNQKKNQELVLFLLLFCITITSIVCHLPRLVLNIEEIYIVERKQRCRSEYNFGYMKPVWYLVTNKFEQLALIFNASINFVFYCLVSGNFRKKMKETLFGWCPKRKGSQGKEEQRRRSARSETNSTQVEMDERSSQK